MSRRRSNISRSRGSGIPARGGDGDCRYFPSTPRRKSGTLIPRFGLLTNLTWYCLGRRSSRATSSSNARPMHASTPALAVLFAADEGELALRCYQAWCDQGISEAQVGRLVCIRFVALEGDVILERHEREPHHVRRRVALSRGRGSKLAWRWPACQPCRAAHSRVSRAPCSGARRSVGRRHDRRDRQERSAFHGRKRGLTSVVNGDRIDACSIRAPVRGRPHARRHDPAYGQVSIRAPVRGRQRRPGRGRVG